MDLDDVKEDLEELEQKLKAELEELDAWWRLNRRYWPLGVLLIAVGFMVYPTPLWVNIVAGLLALGGAYQYAELARDRLAESEVRCRTLRQGMELAQEKNNAWLAAVTSLHFKLFGAAGIGGDVAQWYNHVWRLGGLSEKGAPPSG